MATGTGLDAQIGVKVETTHGTPVTVDRFYPFISETVAEEREQMASQGIIAGRLTRDTEQHKVGVKTVSGDVEVDLYQENAALLWQLALGSITSTSNAGSAPYTHTATLGDLPPSFTYQKGVSSTTNGGLTVIPYTYGGCKVSQFTFSGQTGQPGKMKLSLTGGVIETTGTGLASASFGNNAAVPFIFTEGSATLGGVANRVASFEFTGNNHLATRVYAGDSITREQLREARFEGSGKLSIEFTDAAVTTYDSGTDLDIVLAFNDGTNSVTLTIHTILKGDTPKISGTGVQMVDVMFDDVYGDGSDNDAITAVIVNSGSLTP